MSEESDIIFNETTSLFSSAYKLNPNSTPVLLGLARLYILEEDPSKAKNALLKIQDENNQIIAWLTGRVLYELGDIDAASTYWMKVTPTRWILNMAKQVGENGDIDSAITLYKIALVVDPDYPNANYYLAAVYAHEGEFELAEKYFLNAIALSPTTWWYHLHLAQTYERWGRYQDAIEQYRITVSLVPNKTEIKERLDRLETELNP